MVVTGQQDEINQLVEDFQFRPDGYFYSPLYERYRVTKGKEGWDGYLHPLKRQGQQDAIILRGYGPELEASCRMHKIEYTWAKKLPALFSGLTAQDVPPDILPGAKFRLDDRQRHFLEQLDIDNSESRARAAIAKMIANAEAQS